MGWIPSWESFFSSEDPMSPSLIGALPLVLIAQASPLTYQDLLARARKSGEQIRVDAFLAERQRALSGTRGYLRDGPTLGFSAGPRTSPVAPTTTDRSLDLDLPLFFAPAARRRLEWALGQADPSLREAARLEDGFRLRQAYLDAWLAERVLHLREADLATVATWLRTAKTRVEAGADPAFQASLVEGECLRAQAELDEARRLRLTSWATLRSLAEVPGTPAPLAAPEAGKLPSQDQLRERFERSALRRGLQGRMELEQQTLRHQEALAGSRWSLRGSYARESEERISKLGLAYRFARPGEAQSLRQETEANLQVSRRDLEMALLELDARFQSAVLRWEAASQPSDFTAFDLALGAVSLRLAEGKERPSEALPIRRQLIEAQIASLRHLHAHHLLNAELQALTSGVTP